MKHGGRDFRLLVSIKIEQASIEPGVFLHKKAVQKAISLLDCLFLYQYYLEYKTYLTDVGYLARTCASVVFVELPGSFTLNIADVISVVHG